MQRLVLWHRALPAAEGEREPPAAVVAWARGALARMRASGGSVLGTQGHELVVAFEPSELTDALDCAMELLDDAEAATDPAGGVPVAMAVALGEIADDVSIAQEVSRSDSPLARARVLAHRARRGELVLDREARGAAWPSYAFSGRRDEDSATCRGYLVDRTASRRDACRRTVGHLRAPPVPPVLSDALEPMRGPARAGRGRVVLRGPADAGATTWMAALRNELAPARVLWLESVPGSLEPLGSLAQALRRHWGTATDMPAALERAGWRDTATGERLLGIARGEALERAEVEDALRTWLEGEEGPVWWVLDPADGLDPASLDVVAAVTSATGSAHARPGFVIMRLSRGARVPEPFASEGELTELTLPALRKRDAYAIAREMLGDEVDDHVVARVAARGGETMIGVIEAVRASVASGDLIYRDGRFVWRSGRRAARHRVPPEALFEERAGALANELSQALEIVCVAPRALDATVARTIATEDGLDADTFDRALAELRTGGFVSSDGWAEPSSQLARNTVLQSLWPSRHASLHRRVARALESCGMAQRAFAQAEVGYYWAEGGHANQAAQAWLGASHAALQAGFARSALRLAATAAQRDDSPDTRAEAAALTRTMTRSWQTGELGHVRSARAEEALEDELRRTGLAWQVVEALRAGDFEGVERCLDLATAQGGTRAAAERIRALASGVRGHHDQARHQLAQAQDGGSPLDGGNGIRGALTAALVSMYAGAPTTAVRDALEALATARELGDRRGEAATLRTLAACYRALGRNEDAMALDQAAGG